jgi:hypothetical protein
LEDKKRITRIILRKIGKNNEIVRAVNYVKKDYQNDLYPSLIGAEKTYPLVEKRNVASG